MSVRSQALLACSFLRENRSVLAASATRAPGKDGKRGRGVNVCGRDRGDSLTPVCECLDTSPNLSVRRPHYANHQLRVCCLCVQI